MPRSVARTISAAHGFVRPLATCALEIDATRRTRVATLSVPAWEARYDATAAGGAGMDPPHASNWARSDRYARRVFDEMPSCTKLATSRSTRSVQLTALDFVLSVRTSTLSSAK